MRLIDELIERGAIARSTTVFEDAVCDLQGCSERSARIDDAVRLIRKELMPRILGLPGPEFLIDRAFMLCPVISILIV